MFAVLDNIFQQHHAFFVTRERYAPSFVWSEKAEENVQGEYPKKITEWQKSWIEVNTKSQLDLFMCPWNIFGHIVQQFATF